MPALGYSEEVVTWHHSAGEKPVELPVVLGELAHTDVEGVDNTLFIPGFGEGRESAVKAVQIFEQRFGRPAVAAWLSYSVLPPTESNLLKIATDAPLELAEFARGAKHKVNLVTHSLGDLAVIAAAKDPDKFGSIGLDSPHTFACSHWANLPLVGSIPALRPFVAMKRLGVETFWQLRSELLADPDLRQVVMRGLTDIKKLGTKALSTANFALSNEVASRTVGSYMALSDEGHPSLIVTGGEDRVVPPGNVQRTLEAAADSLGLDRCHYLKDVVIVPGAPHVTWCSRNMNRFDKFQHFDTLVRQTTPPSQKLAA